MWNMRLLDTGYVMKFNVTRTRCICSVYFCGMQNILYLQLRDGTQRKFFFYCEFQSNAHQGGISQSAKKLRKVKVYQLTPV